MKKLRENRIACFVIITLVYLVAGIGGYFLYRLLPFGFAFRLFFADLGATVITFFFSVLLGNASVYDPYWSVQPPVIITGAALIRSMGLPQLLLFLSIWFWGLRLTLNWAYTFRDLNHQDWRYTMLKEKTGKLYPFVNLLGIHLFPTIVVYLAVLPAVFVFEAAPEANIGSFVFFLLSVGAVVLQMISDLQMQHFRKSGRGGLIRDGLWKYARHPNYLGEILMWWGVAGQALSVLRGSWWLVAGALVNTFMFLFISIPMADRRQQEKPGYEEYREETRMLVPLPKRR